LHTNSKPKGGVKHGKTEGGKKSDDKKKTLAASQPQQEK
jgi:hypothetical protein